MATSTVTGATNSSDDSESKYEHGSTSTSSDDYDGDSSVTTGDISTTSQGSSRKRMRHVSSWKKTKTTRLRNLGQEYESTSKNPAARQV